MFGFITRRIYLKLYLWFLLALLLSVAGAGLVSSWLVKEHFGGRARENLAMGQRIAERLLATEQAPEALAPVLEPILRGNRVHLSVLRADGSTVLAWGDPESRPNVTPGMLANMRRETHIEDAGPRHRFMATLPVRLPGGATGLAVLGHRAVDWRATPLLWSSLAGLGAVLAMGALLALPLARHLARPLAHLSDTAARLEAGDLSARAALSRGDEIGQLAARFNAMATQVEALLHGHKQLLADISHELRSPLARLRLALELARDSAGKQEPGKTRGYLDALERESDAMEALIGELLFFARLEAEPYQPRLEPARPEPLAREVTEACLGEARARRPGVALEVDVRVAPPAASLDAPPIGLDPRLFQRALGNVLRNALAHSPGGGRVALTLMQEGARLTVVVRDSGPGIPPEMLAHVLEPFTRVERARERGEGRGGVGLGLAVARRCLEAHGGGLSLANHPDGGLEATLWLEGEVAR